MANNSALKRIPADYKIACICPMGVELAPVEGMLDEIHDTILLKRDQNAYTFGSIGGHNVVVAIMPSIGNNAAATVATQLLNDFPSIRFGLLVGVGGGVSVSEDIRLGDVVVSQPTDTFGGVVQYDLGKRLANETSKGTFKRTGQLNKPPSVLSANVRKLESRYRRQGHKLLQYMSEMMERYPNMQFEYALPSTEDRLFRKSYLHQSGDNCDMCEVGQIVDRPPRPSRQPRIHYGTIGSANIVLKDAVLRDELQKDMNLFCVEAEAAGLMDDFPCLVIRGICDYADSHKNKEWQPYAAAVAAAYMKELLLMIPADQVSESSNAVENVLSIQSAAIHVNNRRNQNTGSGHQFINEHMSGTQNFNLTVQQSHDYDFHQPVGLCLGQAPRIEKEYFVGRDNELEEMAEILKPYDTINEQHRLVLGGIGGLGKTQLAIAYAQRYAQQYASVFWLNATSGNTLATSFQTIAERIFTPRDYLALNPEHMSTHVKSWLSHPRNTSWLLIFDNHDEPETYKVNSYYPDTAHGTIIVTTRRPNLIDGWRFPLLPLQSVEAGIRILETRSGTMRDTYASQLVERLAGLPLALATAGTFLRNSTWTFQQYLEAYKRKWNVTTRTPLVLQEYQDRTLYTTWEISHDRLKKEEPDAAQLLKVFAYFDHQAIWYELLHAGVGDDLPKWMKNIASDSTDFQNVMRVLVDYCFIDIQRATQTYSMHTCVHDWALEDLNKTLEPWCYWYALHCVANSVKELDQVSSGHISYARLTPHAVRLLNAKFVDFGRHLSCNDIVHVECIARLLRRQGWFHSARQLLVEVLLRKEEIFGRDHMSTLCTANNLGNLCQRQGKLKEAEQLYERVLAGQERTLKRNHPNTLQTLNNLGLLYDHQGKLELAEKMYQHVLVGAEKALGPDHPATLVTVNNLGKVYRHQGKLEEAEKMGKRALAGREKALGPDHIETLQTVRGLGGVYSSQGKLAEAEKMFERALAGAEKVLGPDHLDTCYTLHHLGFLYEIQGKLEDAEKMYDRALAGEERAFGPNYITTLRVVYSLGLLYAKQGRLREAEQMFQRAATGRQMVLGDVHPDTQKALKALEWVKEKMARKQSSVQQGP